MSDPTPEPLLSLDPLIVRPTVKIDDTRYEILSPEELSVLDSRRFGLWGEQLNALEQGDPENPELETLVSTIARKVLVGVPDEVFAKLTGRQKLDVIEVFTGLLLRGRMSAAGAIGTALGHLSTGASSFPGSSASTAAGRASGWRTCLSRWFGRTPG